MKILKVSVLVLREAPWALQDALGRVACRVFKVHGVTCRGAIGHYNVRRRGWWYEQSRWCQHDGEGRIVRIHRNRIAIAYFDARGTLGVNLKFLGCAMMNGWRHDYFRSHSGFSPCRECAGCGKRRPLP